MHLASRRLSGNAPHLAWRGEPPGFSRIATGALDLRWGPQGPALVAAGKASPHAVARGPLGIPLPSMPGLGPCVESVPDPEDSSPVLRWILGSSGVSQGSHSSSRAGICTWVFLPSCSSSVTLPFAWIMGSVAFPRGFLRRLSHEAFPQGCPTCHRGVSRSSA